MLPGCFLSSVACFALILLDLVRELPFGSPLSPARRDPDGCAPTWKEGRKKICTGADTQTDVAPAAAVCTWTPWSTLGCPKSPPRNYSGSLLFSVLHEPRGEPSDVPGFHLTGVG